MGGKKIECSRASVCPCGQMNIFEIKTWTIDERYLFPMKLYDLDLEKLTFSPKRSAIA
jgi:hypothetical protein